MRAASPGRTVVCIYLVGGNDSNNMIVPLDSPQGHDAFLVDIPRFGAAISRFLSTL